MGFDVDKFMAHEVTEEERARNWALLKLMTDSVEASKQLDALAAKNKKRVPRKGSKAWQFLQLKEAHPGMPAARINALLPEPFKDDADARALARAWNVK